MSQTAEIINFQRPIVKANVEEGYVQIANTMVEHLAQLDMSGRMIRVAIAIIRKTYGYNKKKDRITASQLAEVMKYEGAHTHLSSDVKKLIKHGVILGERTGSYIGPNPILSDWKTSKKEPKTVTLQPDRNQSPTKPKTVTPLTENGQKKEPKTVNTKDKKDNFTKDNIKKTVEALPEVIPKQTFLEFVKHRKEIKKPFTETQLSKFIKKLERLHAEDYDLTSILDEAIENGWQGIFPKPHHKVLPSQGANSSGYSGFDVREVPVNEH
ncbi:replication protein [uncultured Psychrosphaera sp.]|uniref:replication protein n=1 Tax=uncultured Psychrosphaera sp. TaxID=1403522 RepID=UPI0026214278|nr:replication protein [uncultured Psychrosphaera sp.]